jgi:transcriptional regulator of arginine metabolism
MTTRSRRQNKIKEILQTTHISSHDELIEILAKNDIEITQATLSRDFAAMGVIKSVSDHGIRYSLNADETGREIAKLIGFEILGIDYNEFLIIVRTLAGRAQGVAHFLDKVKMPDVLGTIGGDDTVMVIPKSVKDIKKVVQKINDYITEES